MGDFWFCLNVDEQQKPQPGYTHYTFTVSQNDFTAMRHRIMDAGVTVFKENTSLRDSLYFLDPDGHKLELHVGNWQSRITAKKGNLGAWKDAEWFI